MTINPRDHFVYPGHPVTIAMEIMDAFPDFDAANKQSEHGWPEALSHSEVDGSGGAVYQGLHLLERISKGELDADAAFTEGCDMWRRSREGGDFLKNLERGQELAAAVQKDFVEQVTTWFKAPVSA